MKSSEEKILDLAKKHLNKLDIKTIQDIPLKAIYKEKVVIRDNSILNVWVVSYEYEVFDNEIAFIYIDDIKEEVLYIMDKHGYIENDGTR